MSAAGLLFTTVSVLFLFGLITRYYENTLYRYAGVVALLGHLFVGIAIIPVIPYGWDIQTFHAAATQLVLGQPAMASRSVGSFAAFQALLYAIAGREPTVLAIVNGLLAVLIPIPACYLARQLYPSIDSTDGLTILLLFSPLPFLFTTIPMRDALSILIVFTVLALLVRAMVDHQLQLALLALPLWAMLYLLRIELALIILLGFFIAVIVRGLNRVARRPVSLPSLLGMGALAGLAGFVLFSRVFPLSVANAMVQYRTSGGASYLGFVDYHSWFDVLLAAPTRAIYFQFAPFPLQVNAIFDFVTVLALPLLIVLSIAAYRSLKNCRTNTSILVFLLVVYLCGIVGYGLLDANFGTTARHRIPFVFLLGIFATPVLQRWVRLLRVRFGERPRQTGQNNEQQRKTQKLHTSGHTRNE